MEQLVNIFGYITIASAVLAGFLVVSLNLKVKLLGVSLYFMSNAYSFLLWKYTHLNNFIASAIIFGSLTIINVVRVIMQMKKERK